LIVKSLLARLLLALSLTVNSVAVLAGGLPGMAVIANPASQEMSCDQAQPQQLHSFQVQNGAEECGRTCCQHPTRHSSCSTQHVCVVQHNTFYVAQSALNLGQPVGHHVPDTRVIAVPDFKLPPENPPPIHS